MGVIKSRHHDTTPGAGSVFAPPGVWEGNAQDYRELMRERWREIEAGQHILSVARCFARDPASVRLEGPWRDEAKTILERLAGEGE